MLAAGGSGIRGASIAYDHVARSMMSRANARQRLLLLPRHADVRIVCCCSRMAGNERELRHGRQAAGTVVE